MSKDIPQVGPLLRGWISLSRRFNTRYQIITRSDQSIDPALRTIFVLTQERLLEREDISKIDLFVIDEFYKLNADPTSSRSKALNIAFQRYRPHAKQVFLLGPNVKATIPKDVFDCVIIDSDNVTVATEMHDHRGTRSKRKTLHQLLESVPGRKSLIFCKSPASARKVAQRLIEDGFSAPTSDAKHFSEWLKENYHPEWSLPVALQSGIGIHHGAVPRSIGQRVLRLFNETDLSVLICTSTLIEGVNTKAENIFIYDKKIENRNFDFFSYQNIKGRAGRFGSYLIGHIFLFEDPPEQEQYLLEIPSLTREADVSDEFIIGFDGFGRSDGFQARHDAILEDINLSAELISALATFQIQDIKSAAEIIEAEVKKNNPLLFWSGRTEYHHLAATLNLTWQLFARKSGIVSGNQAAFYSSRLLQSHGNIRQFLERLTQDKTAEELQIELEKAFRSIRAIEFFVPDVLRATELIVNYFCQKYKLEPVEYMTMARMVESYFLPPNVKALEEIGVPTPIGIKLIELVGPDHTLDEVLRIAASLKAEELLRAGIVPYEQELLRSAL